MWKTLPLRGYMLGLRAVTAAMPFRWPRLFEGSGSAMALLAHLAEAGHRRVLVVTDASLVELGLLAPLCAELERLAKLARHCGIGHDTGSDQEKALALIAHIRGMQAEFAIPTRLAALRESDIPTIARAARREARFTYAVPRYLSQAEAEALIRRVLPEPASDGRPSR